MYLYLVREPIDSFWAFAALIPFYIRIVYDAEDLREASASVEAMKRLVNANSIVIVFTVIAAFALASYAAAIPIVLSLALICDVAAYLFTPFARAVGVATAWLPEFLR